MRGQLGAQYVLRVYHKDDDGDCQCEQGTRSCDGGCTEGTYITDDVTDDVTDVNAGDAVFYWNAMSNLTECNLQNGGCACAAMEPPTTTPTYARVSAIPIYPLR